MVLVGGETQSNHRRQLGLDSREVTPRQSIVGHSIEHTGHLTPGDAAAARCRDGHRYRCTVDVVLVPGFWLTASAWDEVRAALAAEGVDARAVTLPGLGHTGPASASTAVSARTVTLDDHVQAIVDALDACTSPVVLVGHSASAVLVQLAADRRPGSVAHLVHVDAVPLPHGSPINADIPAAEGFIQMPSWNEFDEAEVSDLDDDLRATIRRHAVPQPEAPTREPIAYTDDGRHRVPATVVACAFRAEQLASWIEQDSPWTVEIAATEDLTIVDLPGGHWPMFSQPRHLAMVIADVCRR